MLKNPKNALDIYNVHKSTLTYKTIHNVPDRNKRLLMEMYAKANIAQTGSPYNGANHQKEEEIRAAATDLLDIFPEMYEKDGETYVEYVKDLLAFDNILDMWNTTRTVYKINREFYDELLVTENVKFNSSLLDHLQFPTAYVDLEHCDLHYPLLGVERKLKGFFFFVEPDNYGYGVYVATYFEGNIARIFAFQFTKDTDVTLSIDDLMDLRYDDGTELEDREDALVKRFDTLSKYFTEISVLIFNTLLYFCSNESDIKCIPVAKIKVKGKKVDNPHAVHEYQVGYRIGPKLRQARDEYVKIINTTPTDRTVRPHVRKSHWHHYWCGSGENRHPELRWVMWTYVNCDNSKPIDFVQRNANID